jgi:type I restriction enzyme M protein
MAQLENIGAIEKRLWGAADTLRSNSNYASNEYFMPVMGLIFLRHAYSRFLNVRDEIITSLPKRGGKTRELTKEDFSQKGSIFLQEKAQFDYFVSLTDSDDRAKAIIEAMESIENDYITLSGILPKSEYQELDNEVLGQLLRTLNPEELKRASGDIFGRIYEYFLTQFADQKAHDGGEFFTPVSLVSFIANVLEPKNGIVLDPACGSGGMFVQSAHFLERIHANPTERLTFYGMEKNPTTIRLAKMNLAVHGLEGDIQKTISYYEDPHQLTGKADFVMANPPFNVDEVDAEKIKSDPRLPFGLPGVNKNEKISNGNYLWISYFYSYLNEKGRAGFVMSSQASSAGRDEAKVRQKLIETGSVDIMVAVRSNFFYTRTVPCELWFLNRDKPEEYRNKVLMIDAKNIFRKLTRKIYDFSPEQLQNLLSIIWLYRGEEDRFKNLLSEYIESTILAARNSFTKESNDNQTVDLILAYLTAIEKLINLMTPFFNSLRSDTPHTDLIQNLETELKTLVLETDAFKSKIQIEELDWEAREHSILSLNEKISRLAILTENSRNIIKQVETLYKLVCSLIKICEIKFKSKESDLWFTREISKARKFVEDYRQNLVKQLKLASYFYKQAVWLTDRFPEGKLRNVEGLVKVVDKEELKSKDWSLTPGRYVGVTPEIEDEDFDLEETLRDIHIELESLNTEAMQLTASIQKTFKELEI